MYLIFVNTVHCYVTLESCLLALYCVTSIRRTTLKIIIIAFCCGHSRKAVNVLLQLFLYFMHGLSLVGSYRGLNSAALFASPTHSITFYDRVYQGQLCKLEECNEFSSDFYFLVINLLLGWRKGPLQCCYESQELLWLYAFQNTTNDSYQCRTQDLWVTSPVL